ncbi:MAG: Tetraacyldisaccharide 4'-kinase [Syntrophus sp. SKADARSKE-3]|nr:Tetraacyldisaccharide 4'-kinase [Syntrophus sp. SKADARSKE-3]
MSLQTIVKKVWYPREGQPLPALAFLLYPAAMAYGSIIRLRNKLYDRRALSTLRLPCPVISVGNITVGGTGKTPAVIMIARMLSDQGRRPAVLSRGYGGATRAPVNIASDGKSILMTPEDAGDEPVLMARKLPDIPVLTGPGRYFTGKAAIDRFGVDVLVLDDAFQHRKIHRDINILLLDSHSPVGNGLTLPAGPLREPLSALRRADIIIATGMTDGLHPSAAIPDILKKEAPKRSVPVFHGSHCPVDLVWATSGESVPLDALQGRKILAFSGIARPDGFRRTIEAAGGRITSFLTYADHHAYTERDIYDINSAARRDEAEFIVTTEKDGVKLDRIPGFAERVLLLRIAMELPREQDKFIALVMSRIKSWQK